MRILHIREGVISGCEALEVYTARSCQADIWIGTLEHVWHPGESCLTHPRDIDDLRVRKTPDQKFSIVHPTLA